jgi:hypothetical protein
MLVVKVFKSESFYGYNYNFPRTEGIWSTSLSSTNKRVKSRVQQIGHTTNATAAQLDFIFLLSSTLLDAEDTHR